MQGLHVAAPAEGWSGMTALRNDFGPAERVVNGEAFVKTWLLECSLPDETAFFNGVFSSLRAERYSSPSREFGLSRRLSSSPPLDSVVCLDIFGAWVDCFKLPGQWADVFRWTV